MPIRHASGNLLDSSCQVLVNPVNCVGVAGKGLAKRFKDRWPQQVAEYSEFCRAGKMRPGVIHEALLPDGRSILSVPTKRHWLDRSDLDDVMRGIEAIADHCRENEVASIAIPPLGCGLGGLPKSPVKHWILVTMGSLVTEVHLYGFNDREGA